MSKAESFIPLRRRDVLELCAAEQDDADGFRDFGRLLLALLHHQSLNTLDALKDAYAEFNPDRDTIRLDREVDKEAMAETLKSRFDETLLSANYRRLTTEELGRALHEASIIPLDTRVDLDDYCDYAFYYRGGSRKTIPVRNYIRTREIEIENLERVAVLLRFRDPEHFENRRKKWRMEEIDFKPGKIYLYLYKNVPKNDLELLFPNVEVSMTWRDKLLFAVPAVAGAGPLLVKVLPSLGIIAGLIVLMTMGPDYARQLNIDIGEGESIYPILVAVMSASFALGGFAVKQYLNYKNKKLKFQKRVTDTLFFKNLVTNRGVLFTIVDSAEEELGKEMVLAYHHLLRAEGPLTERDLDERVEEWIRVHCKTDVNFDVHKALERLSSFRHHGVSILAENGGHWSALPLGEAKATLDRHWDGLFDHSGE
ncbi:MAG: TMEM143 family protein [Gammaproteobacteria bacterium]|nr:TMEM143 family protein [Gammaproteobacteria bacterium]